MEVRRDLNYNEKINNSVLCRCSTGADLATDPKTQGLVVKVV